MKDHQQRRAFLITLTLGSVAAAAPIHLLRTGEKTEAGEKSLMLEILNKRRKENSKVIIKEIIRIVWHFPLAALYGKKKNGQKSGSG